ncbi:MAG TPA: hypothetical protein VK152_06675 [Paludibacter sp.]|nr:hypothetical protein [Paludibacter sp.]
MRIITTSGEFELPIDFKPTYQRYNPMLVDTGDQTIPMSLPNSSYNLALVGYTSRPDSFYKPVIDFDILFIDGAIARKSTLSLNSLDFSASIDCTIYFNNGDFYSRITDKMLDTDVNFETWKHPDYDNVSLDVRRQYLLDMLRAATFTTDYVTYPFAAVPVYTDTIVTKQGWDDDIRGLGYVKKNMILNAPSDYHGVYVEENHSQIGTDIYIELNQFEGDYELKYKYDGVEVPNEKGYATTPLLRVKYVLEKIFSTFGYTFSSVGIKPVNAFPVTANYFERILLVNTVADAIYGGKLEESQLVPKVSISEFLKEISWLLGGRFIVNEVSRTATFRHYKDVFSENPIMDLTRYKTKNTVHNLPEFKDIEITSTSSGSGNRENFVFNQFINKLITDAFFSDPTHYRIKMTFYQVKEEIIHKNTSLQIDGKEQTEENKSSSVIKLLWQDKITKIIQEGGTLNTGKKFGFYNSIPYFDAVSESEKIRYSEYLDFVSKSNIPATAELLLPKSVFWTLKPDAKYVIDGQEYMYENIEATEFNDELMNVKMTLRTVRSYS